MGIKTCYMTAWFYSKENKVYDKLIHSAPRLCRVSQNKCRCESKQKHDANFTVEKIQNTPFNLFSMVQRVKSNIHKTRAANTQRGNVGKPINKWSYFYFRGKKGYELHILNTNCTNMPQILDAVFTQAAAEIAFSPRDS